MKTVLIICILLCAVSFTSCDDEMTQPGTIKYVDLEMGFYGIVGNDGKQFDPVNLPDEYKIDGLKVEFKFKVSKNQMSFHMWGTLIEITSIEKTE